MNDPAPASARPRRRRSALTLLGVALAAVVMVAGVGACTPENRAKQAIAQYWGADTACANRIVYRESRYQAAAVSPTNDYGLFQLNATANAQWIRNELGYTLQDLKDPYKNSRAARVLYGKAQQMWGDGWKPWRLRSGSGCPA